jgi:hypothetical protein
MAIPASGAARSETNVPDDRSSWAPRDRAVRRATLTVLATAVVLLAWSLPSVGAVIAGPAPPAPLAGTPPPTAPSAIPTPLPAATHAAASPGPTHVASAATHPSPSSSSTFSAPHFRLGGAVPQSWGSTTPPGWEFLASEKAHAALGPAGSNGLPGSYQQWLDNWCNGIWPDVGGQGTYQSNCYGHDEPGIQFYSSLPGSGGNVSWTVTLPTSRSPTQNQSDLYSAIWFGLTLNVPDNAWMNQCFLELQFYPDSGWYAPGPFDLNATVYGNWVGAAVAWQIQASTGLENPCFYEPLYLGGHPGPAFLNMSQGDQITVRMTGWAGDPNGEAISIVDGTNGQNSSVDLYNQSCAAAPAGSLPACGGNYPLDPAYTTNSHENGLQWTPGGEYPVVFAYEIGHTGNPAYSNANLFGGCNPGEPGAAFGNTPCPSYDPGSWTNDTLTPWKFQRPVFFNAQTTETGAQVAFTDPQGGMDLVNGANLFGAFPWSGACTDRPGTAFCSYPWYSYYCSTHEFEFGATDYPGVSADFGQSYQYATGSTANGAGWQYYPPLNFSVPTCGGPSYGVSVGAQSTGGAGGAAYFLSQPYYGTTNVSSLGPGEYSISALPVSGSYFRGWTTSGGASVASATSAYTSLDVTGNGGVWANFGTTPAVNVTVTWVDEGAGGQGWITATNGSTFQFDAPLGTWSNGSTVTLAPGVYGIEGYPPSGYNFSSWSASAGASVAASGYPWTVLVLDGSSDAVTVTAGYVASPMNTAAVVVGLGNGTVTFGGVTAPYYANFGESFMYYYAPVGSYLATATAAPGWAFQGWTYSPAAVMNGFFSNASYVDLEGSFVGYYGPSTLVEAIFAQLPPPPVTATFLIAPAAGGSVSLGGGAPVGNGTSMYLGTGTYSLAAIPSGGYTFAGWAASPSANASFGAGTSITSVTITGNVTIYANYTASAPETLGFVTWPSAGGSIWFNLQPYSGTAYNDSVAIGTYLLSENPAPGYAFVRFQTFGPVFVTGGSATVYGTDGYIDAVFTSVAPPPPPEYAVTFVTTAPGSVGASLGGTALSSGETVWLPAGTTSLSAISGSASVSTVWSATANLQVGNPAQATTTLTVYGPGTVYAVANGWVGPTTVAPGLAGVGTLVTFSSQVGSFVGAVGTTWNGLPSGCTPSGLDFSCAVGSAGTYSVSVTATFPGGASVTSNVAELTVSVLPSATVGVAPGVIDAGSATLLTFGGAGGSAPLTLSVSGLPAGCQVAGFGSVSCLPLASGEYTITATVTDALGESSSAHALLTVVPRLNLTGFSSNVGAATVGTPIDLSASVLGGAGPVTYAYSGLPSDCPATATNTVSCTSGLPGTYVVTVVATDAIGVRASGATAFVVNPAPEIPAFTVSDPAPVAGGSVTFTTNAVFGTGPLTYAYSGLPPGCPAAPTGASFSCALSAVGSYTVGVTVTDADHASATASVSVNVQAAPSTTAAASPSMGTFEALAIAGLVLGLAGLLAALVVGMRRPKGGEPSPP